MNVNWTILLIILGCAAVTWIPRVVPFMVIRKMALPKAVEKWLSYIPVCIFAALIADSMLMEGETALPALDWTVLAAGVPTLAAAVWTKSLSITVIVGVVCMAGVRLLF